MAESSMRPAMAWLCISKDDGRLSRGAESWSESLGETYRWADTVQRAEELKRGDTIDIWNDRDGLVGFSWIDDITIGSSQRREQKCPHCGSADIYQRTTLTPPWKCKSRECKQPFYVPSQSARRVKTFTANYAAGWVEVPHGTVSPAECRELCVRPKTQHSMRVLDNAKFAALLSRLGTSMSRPYQVRGQVLAGGFGTATVRTRRGQSGFRKKLLDRYGSVCAVTGQCPDKVLDAAHLYRYSLNGEHHEDGGLLLRADIHRLFDAEQLTVDPLTLRVKLMGELSTSEAYSPLEGRPLATEISDATRGWLAEHWKQAHGLLAVHERSRGAVE